MKKVFGALFLAFFCVAFVFAEEEGDSKFKPGFSLGNEFGVKTWHSGEDKSKGNVGLNELSNETSVEFSVGIDLFEGFTLKPYISDAFSVASDADKRGVLVFDANDFVLGLGGSYKPLDMLTVSFGIDYVSKYALRTFEMEGLSPIDETFAGNGFNFKVGVGAEIENIFLELGLDYKLKGMFANTRVLKDSTIRESELKNIIALDSKFDFFNFIKEGLNSGLLLSDEVTIKSENTHIKGTVGSISGEGDMGALSIENEFAIGLHFAPVEFMDAKFLAKFNSASEKPWDDEGKKYGEAEQTTEVGLSMGLDFSKEMFSFGIEYNPTLYSKTGDKDPEKTLGHEFKFTFGIEL